MFGERVRRIASDIRRCGESARPLGNLEVPTDILRRGSAYYDTSAGDVLERRRVKEKKNASCALRAISNSSAYLVCRP